MIRDIPNIIKEKKTLLPGHKLKWLFFFPFLNIFPVCSGALQPSKKIIPPFQDKISEMTTGVQNGWVGLGGTYAINSDHLLE